MLEYEGRCGDSMLTTTSTQKRHTYIVGIVADLTKAYQLPTAFFSSYVTSDYVFASTPTLTCPSSHAP